MNNYALLDIYAWLCIVAYFGREKVHACPVPIRNIAIRMKNLAISECGAEFTYMENIFVFEFLVLCEEASWEIEITFMFYHHIHKYCVVWSMVQP